MEEHKISDEQLQENLLRERAEILRDLEDDLYYQETLKKETKEYLDKEKLYAKDLAKLEDLLLHPKPGSVFIDKILDRYANNPEKLHEIGKKIYYNELVRDSSIIKPNPPYNDLTKKILLERATNFEDYAKYSQELIVENILRGYDYRTNLPIPDSYKLSDLIEPNDPMGRIRISTAYNLSDEFLSKLFTCKKDILVPSKTLVKKDHTSTGTFYIGKVDNQNIIFYERIYKNNKNIGNSYYLCCLVGGKINMKIPLIRGDYRPDINHYNKTKNWNSLPKEYFKDEPCLHDQELDARNNEIERLNKINTAIETCQNNINALKENQKLIQNEAILSNIDNEIKKMEEKIAKLNKMLKKSKLLTPFSHVHINRQFYSVLFPKQANGMDVHYLSHNQIFNNKIEDYKDYLAKNKIRNFEDFIDNIDKMSMQELNTFDKFIYFLRESSGIDLKENQKLINPQISTTSNENYVCQNYIPSTKSSKAKEISLNDQYDKFLEKNIHKNLMIEEEKQF